MDVTWGVTCRFVPTRGTDMETTENKQKHGDKDNTMTICYGTGHEEEVRENEGVSSNPFARAPRVMRTPPKGHRPRTDSCPELRLPLGRGLDEKRKRTEADSLSPPSAKETTTTERESRTGDEVFVVKGSPSPEAARKLKKKRELEPLSPSIAGIQIGETEEESAMTNGLIQMMQKLENMTSEMTYQTKKHVNTKVEIKKLAKEIDMMSQVLARKLHKYCKVVAKKLRRSSDKESSPVSAHSQREKVCTQDAASQTEPSLRKQRRREDEEKRVTEAATDEDIIEAAHQKWQEEWFKATTVRDL